LLPRLRLQDAPLFARLGERSREASPRAAAVGRPVRSARPQPRAPRRSVASGLQRRSAGRARLGPRAPHAVARAPLCVRRRRRPCVSRALRGSGAALAAGGAAGGAARVCARSNSRSSPRLFPRAAAKSARCRRVAWPRWPRAESLRCVATLRRCLPARRWDAPTRALAGPTCTLGAGWALGGRWVGWDELGRAFDGMGWEGRARPTNVGSTKFRST